MSKHILQVKDLRVSFNTYAGEVQAVRGVSFDLKKGEVLAIVGESGCGKSVTAQTIMRLIPSPPSVIKSGSIKFDEKTEITRCSNKEMESIRGSEMGMIFQDPMTSLNPTMTVGKQITEGLMKHEHISNSTARLRAIEILKQVGMSNPEGRMNQYPHEFSGGMRQRVMIAIALACSPKLLIADEPTTALDVTIQAQIIDLMKKLSEETEASIIVITHDLGVVAEMAQQVIVMYAGKVAERGTVNELFYEPQHPYTWGLLRSVPRLDQDTDSELVPIPGSPPDLFAPPKGCAFAARCPYAMQVCLDIDPEHFVVSETHSAACWLLHHDAPKVDRPKEAGGVSR
ncbi:ATP-binding cassette domain-containing protein [Paenibacillus sp. LMG 31456]|uniref:ATP-binding cassette domain-containing protein n=1 Tax=Paenibacillus foliorum TaxID=2654974 RepID=A0A972H372_9BACL|nr:ABC transporter ATP-binding protein [Paenibacillus foliorum]NOU95416.1 ATP-binding cassette domain-containing protein [Paenibacillus foliorum]